MWRVHDKRLLRCVAGGFPRTRALTSRSCSCTSGISTTRTYMGMARQVAASAPSLFERLAEHRTLSMPECGQDRAREGAHPRGVIRLGRVRQGALSRFGVASAATVRMAAVGY